MGIKRLVDVQFWNDDKVIELFSPEDKLFMLYLITNPHTTQLGIYAINKKHMSFELGYTVDTINVLLDRFQNKYKMIRYCEETKEIAIKNYLRHSIIKGGAPVRDCLIKEIKNVKSKDLIIYVFTNLKQYELNDTVDKLIKEYEEKNGELLYTYINNNINNNINNSINDNDNEVSYHDTCDDTYTDSKIKRKKLNKVLEKKLKLLFDNFWEAYPKKKAKVKAEEWFEKNSPNEELVKLMIKQVNRFKDTEEWKKADGQYIPYPTSWLNGKRWEDEFETDSEKDKRIQKEIENDIY